jgi:hypothetical protein
MLMDVLSRTDQAAAAEDWASFALGCLAIHGLVRGRLALLVEQAVLLLDEDSRLALAVWAQVSDALHREHGSQVALHH